MVIMLPINHKPIGLDSIYLKSISMSSLAPSVSPPPVTSAQPVSIGKYLNKMKISAPVGGKLISPVSLFNQPHEEIHLTEGNVSQSVEATMKQIKGKTWVGRMASNGNREVGIMIPKGADYNKPFELIYYFHGHSKSNQIVRQLSGSDYSLKDEIETMANQPDRNIMIVFPNGPLKAGHYKWFKRGKEDLGRFLSETQEVIQQKLAPGVEIGSVTVKGHSAGGYTILDGLKNGHIKADRVDFLDASYGAWATSAFHYAKKANPNVEFNSFYIPNTKTAANSVRLSRYANAKVISSSDRNSLSLANRRRIRHSTMPQAAFGYQRS